MSSGWILRRCRARAPSFPLKSPQKPLRGPYERCLKSPLRGTRRQRFKTTVRPKKSRQYGGSWLFSSSPLKYNKQRPKPLYLCVYLALFVPVFESSVSYLREESGDLQKFVSSFCFLIKETTISPSLGSHNIASWSRSALIPRSQFNSRTTSKRETLYGQMTLKCHPCSE